MMDGSLLVVCYDEPFLSRFWIVGLCVRVTWSRIIFIANHSFSGICFIFDFVGRLVDDFLEEKKPNAWICEGAARNGLCTNHKCVGWSTFTWNRQSCCLVIDTGNLVATVVWCITCLWLVYIHCDQSLSLFVMRDIDINAE